VTYASFLHDNATVLLKELAVCVMVGDRRPNVPPVGGVDNKDPTLVAKVSVTARRPALKKIVKITPKRASKQELTVIWLQPDSFCTSVLHPRKELAP